MLHKKLLTTCQCPKCGTSLFFVEDDDKESIDVTLGSITTPNLFDYVEMIGHVWVEDAKELVLDEAGKGGGASGNHDRWRLPYETRQQKRVVLLG